MSQTITGPLDAQRTALLVMDYQPAVLGMLPGAIDVRALTERVRCAAALTRRRGGAVAYCRVGLTDDDYDAVPAANKAFTPAARHRLMPADDPATAIDERLTPQPDDIVVRKTRYGAFSTTDLHGQLRERGVTTLVLAGVSTSGVVLSTVVDAADRDYRLVVLTDCVADADAETHGVLVRKVFPRLADLATAADLNTLLAPTGTGTGTDTVAGRGRTGTEGRAGRTAD